MRIRGKILLMAVAFLLLPMTTLAQNADEARKIMDKVAAVVGQKSGAQAHFTIHSGKYGGASGDICIKGNKFHATTPQATVWFDGKTQWSYMKKTNEVNVTTPDASQRAQMNPYTFINMYKSGYRLTMKDKGDSYEVHLVAQTKKSIPQMYIIVNKKTYVPSIVKIRQGGVWSSIILSNFKARKLSDAIFTFHSKDFPTAELIDLR